MGIESSHLNLNFENEARKLAAVEDARRRMEAENKDFSHLDERIVNLTRKYKELLEINGFTPNSGAIADFIKISEHSLSSYPEAIEKFRKEIELINEAGFGGSSKKETTH